MIVADWFVGTPGRVFRVASGVMMTALLAGCPLPPVEDTDDGDSDTDTDVDPGEPVLVGTFVDPYEGGHDITADTWTQGESVFHLMDWSSDQGWIVAENDAGNEWNPGKWSRFDVLEARNGAWYCQTRFDAASEDEARTTPAADDADPTASGCGGFPWTRLYVPLPVRGDWVDNFGGTHKVREWRWESDALVFHVSDYDLDAKWIVAQNDNANAWNPGKWSRFDWVEQGGAFWFCQAAFDADSEAAAKAAPASTSTDPATGGCGGFPWSSLSR
jgi:hypothetical protein